MFADYFVIMMSGTFAIMAYQSYSMEVRNRWCLDLLIHTFVLLPSVPSWHSIHLKFGITANKNRERDIQGPSHSQGVVFTVMIYIISLSAVTHKRIASMLSQGLEYLANLNL